MPVYNKVASTIKEGDVATDFDFIKLVNDVNVYHLGNFPTRMHHFASSDGDPVRNLLLEVTEGSGNKPVIAVNEEQKKGPIFKEWFEIINKMQDSMMLNLPPVNDFYYFRDYAKPYHIDRIPSPGSYTAVLTLKRESYRGYLVFPDYNVGTDMQDCSLLLFNGREILHGVTPIITNNPKDSYRISVVFYHTTQK